MHLYLCTPPPPKKKINQQIMQEEKGRNTVSDIFINLASMKYIHGHWLRYQDFFNSSRRIDPKGIGGHHGTLNRASSGGPSWMMQKDPTLWPLFVSPWSCCRAWQRQELRSRPCLRSIHRHAQILQDIPLWPVQTPRWSNECFSGLQMPFRSMCKFC